MHIPVMLMETVDRMDVHPGGVYLDCTTGDGGHSAEILRRAGPSATLIALDRDASALARAKERLKSYPAKIHFVHTNHSLAGEACDSLGIKELDGAVIDTGVSSEQLDEAGRGFSFRADGPLDMRMDLSTEETAAGIVASYAEEELASLFRNLGEEPCSRQIAKAIVREREFRPITGTAGLAQIVEKAIGPAARARRRHPATRVFQALRMKVNGELEALELAIEAILQRLRPGGRLSVITFESISDRLVKTIFAKHAGREESLMQGGSRWVGTLPKIRKTDRHAVIPTEEEISFNPRSRSAKLRGAIKL